MFELLGKWVNRYWMVILAFWVVLTIGLKIIAPTWNEVALDGDFDYLPADSTSRRGLDLLQQAFPDEHVKSQVVLVFAREQSPLTGPDRQFAIDVGGKLRLAHFNDEFDRDQFYQMLSDASGVETARILWSTELEGEQQPLAEGKPPRKTAATLGLSETAKDELISEMEDAFDLSISASRTEQLATVQDLEDAVSEALPWADRDPNHRVWTQLTPVVGEMLKNDRHARPTSTGDGHKPAKNLRGHAVMVVGRLTTDMMATENVSILRKVTELLEQARSDPAKPEGLKMGLSGSAMIGGDMQASVQESLKSTELTTVVLVLLCLVVIYRAPLLVAIPLCTIGVSLSVASDVVALMAQYLGPGDLQFAGFTSDFKIFTTTKIFVVVILFGAGTDFCLFLISRFKEELGLGTELAHASGRALTNVGDALAASAFTTILGLATMFFAEYGKFIYSGPVIAVCLFIALLACITFAPSLLRAFGKVVFWPSPVETDHEANDGSLTFDQQMKRISPVWDKVAQQVLRRPGLILWIAFGAAAVFMLEGLNVQVTHDFMNELADDRASKQGTQLIREYFPPGESAPMSVVALLPDGDLNNNYDIAYLNTFLYNMPGVTDVRSLYKPSGGDPTNSENVGEATIAGSPLAKSTFVSKTGEYAGEVTQFQLVLDQDPFSREARSIVDEVEARLERVSAGEAFPEQKPDWYAGSQDSWNTVLVGLPKWKGATFDYIGVTPGMRDLEHVTSRDEWTIKVWVVCAVFAVIVLILRRPLVCLYLIVTVLLSYFATIGMTEYFFRWYYSGTYDGLDWKVPIFLFVILIAVGQDYNIYLTTRVFEEQRKFGLHRGLRKAMVQTGGIITSCGIIMAGTFIAMTSGTLRGMIEIGFALALGVLLDTFFVRTIVVPCFFALMAGKEPTDSPPPAGTPANHEQGSPAPRHGSGSNGAATGSAVTETAS